MLQALQTLVQGLQGVALDPRIECFNVGRGHRFNQMAINHGYKSNKTYLPHKELHWVPYAAGRDQRRELTNELRLGWAGHN